MLLYSFLFILSYTDILIEKHHQEKKEEGREERIKRKERFFLPFSPLLSVTLSSLRLCLFHSLF